MRSIQGILMACVVVLIAMVFYSYWSGNDMDEWLKVWLIVCVILYMIRLYIKHKKNGTEK